MQLDEDLILECDRAVRTSRTGETRMGLDLARKAHRRAREAGEPRGILLALNTVAICQSGNGAHVQSLATAIDAYRLARGIAERAGAAHALLTLVAAAHDLFESPSEASTRILLRCLEEALAIPDASLEVRTRNVLANNLGRRKRFDESLDQFERAMARIPASDGTTPPSLLAGNIAHLMVRRADAAEGEARAAAQADAHRRLDAAMELARSGRSSGDELRVHYNRGWLLRQQGRPDEALADYQRALDISTRLRNPARIADIHVGIGDTHASLGRHEAAAAAYEAALAQADELRPLRLLFEACERLAEARERTGNTRGAAHARELAARERAVYDRERGHARVEFERILEEIEAR